MIRIKPENVISHKKLFEVEPKPALGALPSGVNQGKFADKVIKAIKKAGWEIETERWTVNEAGTSCVGVVTLMWGEKQAVAVTKPIFAIMHNNNCQCNLTSLYGLQLADGTVFWGAEGFITTTHYAEIGIEKFIQPMVDHFEVVLKDVFVDVVKALETKVSEPMLSHFLTSNYENSWIGIPHLKKIFFEWKKQKVKSIAGVLASVQRATEDMSTFTSFEVASKVRGAIATVFKLPQFSIEETRKGLNPVDRSDRTHTVAGRWKKPEVTKAIRNARKKKATEAAPLKEAPTGGTNKASRTAKGKRQSLKRQEAQQEAPKASSAGPKGFTTRITGKGATAAPAAPAETTTKPRPKATTTKAAAPTEIKPATKLATKTTTATKPVETKPATKPAAKTTTKTTTPKPAAEPAPSPVPAEKKTKVTLPKAAAKVSEYVEPEPEPEPEVEAPTPAPAAKATKPRPSAKK